MLHYHITIVFHPSPKHIYFQVGLTDCFLENRQPDPMHTQPENLTSVHITFRLVWI